MSSPNASFKLSSAQERYINDLLAQRALTQSQREEAKRRLPDLTKQQASAWIDRLKSLPMDPLVGAPMQPIQNGTGIKIVSAQDPMWRPNPRKPDQEPAIVRSLAGAGPQVVPEGNYALPTPADDLNPIKFYRIWIGERKWHCYVYASDETYPLSYPVEVAILKQIALNPGEAAIRYGHEKGQCGICGRGLTRGRSRAAGIGPVCAAKWGWPYPEYDEED